MEKSAECQSTFAGMERKEKIKKSDCKNSGYRDCLAGSSYEEPMPWMVLINIKGSQCEGTLINNEFVLTAAHCFCGTAMMCDRGMKNVEENRMNKIRVSSKSFRIPEFSTFCSDRFTILLQS